MSEPVTPLKRAVRDLDWVILGGFLGLAGMGAAVLIVIEAGLFDATATKPHLPIVAWATHTAFKHSVARRAPPERAPIPLDPATIESGFRLYDCHCAVCHGGVGQERAPWVRGINPTPPYLVDSARRWSPGELRWIIGQGVKMTAMPAWRDTMSDKEITDVIAFLEVLPDLSAPDYARMKAAWAAPAPAAPAPPRS